MVNYFSLQNYGKALDLYHVAVKIRRFAFKKCLKCLKFGVPKVKFIGNQDLVNKIIDLQF